MTISRRVTGFIIALLIPLGISAPVFAASQPVTQHITVTAVVPSHRDIVLDSHDNITAIYSNTKDDVTPTVYLDTVMPENQRPLTAAVYEQYRTLVPEGTAKYGVLYKRPVIATLLSSTAQPLSAPSFFSRLFTS